MKRLFSVVIIATVLSITGTSEAKAQSAPGWTWAQYWTNGKAIQRNPRFYAAIFCPMYGYYVLVRLQTDYKYTLRLQYDRQGNEIIYSEVTGNTMMRYRTSHADGEVMTYEEFLELN